MKKQARKQIQEYKRQLRRQGVPPKQRRRMVREFKKQLRKQRRQALRQV